MKSFAVFALVFLLPASALAQHQVFTVNSDASVVKMTLNTTREVVHGTFHIQSGSIGFDRNAPYMSGSVIVLAGSGKTGNSIRDKRMNQAILHVEQHAMISFEPISYTGTITPSGDSTIRVTGIFTLLGTPHEITIPMLVQLQGATATVNAHFAIPYIHWGLKDPSFLFWKAQKEVDIDLNLIGHI